MRKATFQAYTDAHDLLRSNSGGMPLGNFFSDARELRRQIEKKNCLLHEMEKALFLLVPRHGLFHDCLYLAADADALGEGLRQLLLVDNGPQCVRASVIDREPRGGKVAEIFRNNGFALKRKLLRTRNKKLPPEKLKILRELTRDIGIPDFAHPDEAEEIREILWEDFDPAGDNLPELDAIRENAAKGQIAVLRRDGHIASLHYFTIANNICHHLFDVTRKPYRKEGLFLALIVFMQDYFATKGKNIKRSLGWREESAKRLVKFAEETDSDFDGVVIYNMLYGQTPECSGRNP